VSPVVYGKENTVLQPYLNEYINVESNVKSITKDPLSYQLVVHEPLPVSFHLPKVFLI
jgi:hypothetical protein